MAGAGVIGLIKALANIDSAVIKAAIDAWLDDHPEATTTVEDGAITYAKLASALKEILNKKADDDGYYESMTVGDAEQLVATVGVNDKVPYLFRTSGGSADIGDREVDKLVGGSFPWNQLIAKHPEDYTSPKGVVISASDTNGKINITGTRTSTGWVNITVWQFAYIANHKVLVISNYKEGENQSISAGTPLALLSGYTQKVNLAEDSDHSCIFTDTTSGTWRFGIGGSEDDVYDFSFAPMVVDLTQLFGSTIADYIYSLESSTPGAGVAWFRKLFPKPYYAYNAGKMESVCADLHKMVGFNILQDQLVLGERWTDASYLTNAGNAYASLHYAQKVVPNTTYTIALPNITAQTQLYYYECDANGDRIVKNHVSVPTNTKYATFITGDNTHSLLIYLYRNSDLSAAEIVDACINIHWDGERDGEYEPYVAHTYDLDPVVLRGIPYLDSGNKLAYRGDVYHPDGTVDRLFAEVDLGSFTWNETGEGEYRFFYVGLTGAKAAACRCAKYDNVGIGGTNTDTGISVYNGVIRVRDNSYETADAFKTAMDGVKLVYELTTPTTESANPYQTPQIVDDWGTEEYVDALATAASNPRDVAIPVGHDTTYRQNLRAKLEMAPESPSGDGDYILRQTSGQNEYVLLEKELPSLPTEDGTYTLKCTVSGSTKTLTWESDAE